MKIRSMMKYCYDGECINEYFFPNYPVSNETADAMLNDPWYGLNRRDNWAHWQPLVYTNDPDEELNQMIWMWEMRSYFGLSYHQAKEFQENWNLNFTIAEQQFFSYVPSYEPYKNATGAAYW